MEDVVASIYGWVLPDKWRIDGKLYGWSLVQDPQAKINDKPAYRLLLYEVEEEEKEK